MRTFFSTHWKSILVLVILVLLAIFTMTPGAATPELAARLRAHVLAIATSGPESATAAELERAARHIESALAAQGYKLRRQEYKVGGQRVRNIEVSITNVDAHARPERIFIVGARYDPAPDAPAANDKGSGTAAVLELARLLRQVQPARGTEVKFVFFVNEELPRFVGTQPRGADRAHALRRAGPKVDGKPIVTAAGRYGLARSGQHPAPELEGRYPDSGSFIAFVGTRASSAPVRLALAAFRGGAELPAEGLAAPSYVEGVTLSDHSSLNRLGYPALIITDTAFLRYPYFHTSQDGEDKLDYEGMARVVKGLARTIGALAGGTRT
jgi:hypothetical protein